MVAAVALFAAASCNKELPQENLPAVGETVVYTASTDGADTKAVLNETAKKSEWVADDAITVHDGTKGWTFTTDQEGPNVDFSNSEGFGEYRPVLAVYPAGTYTVNVTDKTAKAYIPTWQQAQAGTYHSPAALAVAYSEGNTFAFKNAHALLKFTVNTDNVTHVIFHGNGSEAITGDVNVTLGEDGVESVECLETVFTSEKWNDETQQNEQVSETKYGTWVECYAYHDDANKYFAKGQTYYIAVAPQKFEGGVTVRVKIDGGEELVAKTTTNPVETKINTILNLGEIKYEAPVVHEWYLVGAFNDWTPADANYKMTLDGEWYVFKNFTADGNAVKFVADAAWTINRGGSFIANQAIEVAQGGSNMTVPAGKYDVYLSADAATAYFMTPGLLPGEAPEPEGIYAEEGWVYLKPNSNWTQDSARFAIYFYGNGETWVSMTKVEGTNYYGVKITDIISNGYTGMIFCRMNPGAAANNWDNKWNQTGDLTVATFTSGKNCFSVPSGSWNGATTGWSTVDKLN